MGRPVPPAEPGREPECSNFRRLLKIGENSLGMSDVLTLGAGRTRRCLEGRAGLGIVCVLWAVGCGGASAGAVGAGNAGEVTRRDTKVQHAACDVESKSAERVDVNGDGQADVTIVRSGGAEVCRAVDLNFDGTVDAWVYRDGGQVARRESDYDRDGRIDEIQIFKGGQLVEKHRATTLAGKLDTWQFYEQGRLARTERDSDGDAIVDQWWEYPKPDKPECPLIHSDIDGDGRPDPGATVDVCSEGTGYVPPERAAPKEAEGASFDSAGPAVPTEVEDKPAGAKPDKAEGGDE